MRSKKMLLAFCLTTIITCFSCNTESNTDKDTSAIAGEYRKNNVAWTGTYGPCEVNQIFSITRNGNDYATVVASYEVITEPASGLGAPVINYVGSYSLSNCLIAKTDGIITINYNYPNNPGGDISIVSNLSGNLSGNNLTLSVTRGGVATSGATFVKQ